MRKPIHLLTLLTVAIASVLADVPISCHGCPHSHLKNQFNTPECDCAAHRSSGCKAVGGTAEADHCSVRDRHPRNPLCPLCDSRSTATNAAIEQVELKRRTQPPAVAHDCASYPAPIVRRSLHTPHEPPNYAASRSRQVSFHLRI